MITVEKLTPNQWKIYSANAHKIAFNELMNPDDDRIDFSLVSIFMDSICGYITCREVDSKTLYWAYGGAMPNIKNTALSFKAYSIMAEKCKESGYFRIFTLIENTNLVMLKFAMKIGFKIIGTKTFKGSILVEHVLEFMEE